jgi:hypothetical protein
MFPGPASPWHTTSHIPEGSNAEEPSSASFLIFIESLSRLSLYPLKFEATTRITTESFRHSYKDFANFNDQLFNRWILICWTKHKISKTDQSSAIQPTAWNWDFNVHNVRKDIRLGTL